MKKRFLSCFILILIFLSFFSLSAFSETALFYYGFEYEDEAFLWNGAFYDESAAFSGESGIIVQNPLGEVKDGKVTNVLEYNDKITLEAGKFYTLSGYVLNPEEEHFSSIRCNTSLGAGNSSVFITVSGANSEWAEFNVTFYATHSGEFDLSIYFENTSDVIGAFVDEIVLYEEDCFISSIGLIGAEKITIPSYDSVTENYTPYILTSNSKKALLLSNDVLISSVDNYEGVYFNPSNMTLTVSPNAPANTQININFALVDGGYPHPHSFEVFLTNNLILDSALDGDILSDWSGTNLEAYYTEENNYLSVDANEYTDSGYVALLEYNTPQLLIEGSMYVLHAKVKSTSPEATTVFEVNSSLEGDGSVFYMVNNSAGENWHDVFASFIPDVSGIYTIDVLFKSNYDCTIYVDDIMLCAESLMPTQVTLHAPGNITIPDEKTLYPAMAYVRDQLGDIISEDLDISLSIENESVYYDYNSSSIVVMPDAIEGEYILSARYENLYSEIAISLSHDFIGDGTFEKKAVNEWWVASSPYMLNFRIADNGNKYAHVDCAGEYFALLNNSYIHLMEKGAYVFRGNFSASRNVTVTVFLDTLQNEVIPLAQFSVQGGETLDMTTLPQLFLSESNSVGRLMFYCQSDSGDDFSVSFDNLVMKKASILVSAPYISGDLYVNGAGYANFGFYNSVSGNSDTSSCVINWYVSDNPYGEWTQLSESSRYIYFDTSFKDKYVYFDVTPVCPITGFSGDTLKSGAVKIMVYDEEYPPEESVPPSLEDTTNKYPFSDIQTHWAKDYILYLYDEGIVNGKYENAFAPQDFVTRAEIAKLICTAFKIPLNITDNYFNDVNKDDWFSPYVNALYKYSITKGAGDGMYLPNQPITREELSTLLIRLYEKEYGVISDFNDSSFYDFHLISSWAQEAVNKAVYTGLVKGDNDNFFNPKNNATRAEAATLIYRLINM